MTPKRLDDELLMAYADGELDAARAAEVEAALADDPDARRTLEMFLRSGALVRHAFDRPLREPVPERLREAVRSGLAQAPAVSLSLHRDITQRGRGWRLALPAAASVALAIGLSLGWWMGGHGDAGPLLASAGTPAVQEALERLPTGRTTGLAQGGRAALIATFRDQQGSVCREIELSRGAEAVLAVACRLPTGTWWTEAVAVLPAVAPGTGYEPADAGAGLAHRLAGIIGPTTPVEAAEEQALIGRGWRP